MFDKNLADIIMGKRASRKLDKIIVMDLEATCWEGEPPEGQQNEIIEIGITSLDPVSGKLFNKQSLLIKPTVSEVSEFCTSLTTLTAAQLADGMTFGRACKLLKVMHGSKHRTWASYGDFDRTSMMRQCARMGVEYPFSQTHINVKNLFAIKAGLRKEIGMHKALKSVGIELEGTHHRGHDDAYNTAKLLRYIFSIGETK